MHESEASSRTLPTDAQSVTAAFHKLFEGHETAEVRLFRAPGRVNLIGEHTDYNDGFVLPIAINYHSTIAAAARDDSRVRVHTMNRDETLEFDLEDTAKPPRGSWLNYIAGTARGLTEGGIALRGADMVLVSDVPEGGGLSSSAALEVSAGFALLRLAGVEVDLINLARAGQYAEHNYVGTRSGIMDQYIAAMGRENHALLIDCRSLESALVPLDSSKYELLICNTNVKHSLANSEYNTRRAECEKAVELLREALPHITALRDVSIEDFKRHQDLLPDVIKRRARHVVTENERTLETVEALRRNNMKKVGELMYASHVSLRDDYAVSCLELDTLIEIAREHEIVAGARMTGGGFGGCTVNLVRRDTINNTENGGLKSFTENLKREYHLRIKRKTGRELHASIYHAVPSDGVHELFNDVTQ
ncbi:MAG: galactokinase [Pyrinomonadaceae bacterium MAG19_C2-C3]|nr:galactokinase [Pyrinomonadaceae bacterium MAG19_C2-C3]